MRILLSTTSFQDTPGPHHELLAKTGFEIVRARGPLPEAEMLRLIAEGGFDALLCGDDQITKEVIDAALPRLRVIAKYGIGLDSIDVAYATEKHLAVLNTPGVNHTTVAEHTIGLMIAGAKHFWTHFSAVKDGQWKRVTGRELYGKTLGLVGLGRIGKEVAIRTAAFQMKIIAFDQYFDVNFTTAHGIEQASSLQELFEKSDVISLHTGLNAETREMINKQTITRMKDGVMIINTSRGGCVNEYDIAEACRTKKVSCYAADVLCDEPIKCPHPFDGIDSIIVTPHVASRTFESVERQAVRAVLNMVNYLNGDRDYIQANHF